MKTITTAAMLAACTATTVGAETFELTISSSHGNVIPWVKPLTSVVVAQTNERLEAMGSEHRVDWIEAYGGSLYGFSDTLEAVGDGITDMGWVGTLWEESKMPYQNLTYYTPFTTDDVDLMLDTANQLHADLPFMQEAWDEHNTVFLGATGADTYHLYTTFPVNSLEDLRGRKILAPGPSGAWMSAIGAVPVDGALPTYYNQIETGVADGVLSIMSGVYPLKIYEVTPYVTLVGAGASMIGGFAVNKDTWEGLPEDVRTVLSDLGQEYSNENSALVAAGYQFILDTFEADPSLTVTSLSQEDREAWAAALPDLAGTWAGDLPHGAELIEAYMKVIQDGGGKPLRDWSLTE